MINQKWRIIALSSIITSVISCSTSAPGINHLLNEQYHEKKVPVSMKVDLGPFANKQFHYSELSTAAGINQRIVLGKAYSVELFENLNLNPEAGLSVSGFQLGQNYSLIINGYIATCVLGNRRRSVSATGKLSKDFVSTEYAPLLYGIQSRMGCDRYLIGIDFLKNSYAYDPRPITKEYFWDYLVDRRFFDKNPQPENLVKNFLKISGVVQMPEINMALSVYYIPPVKPFKNRLGIEVSYLPPIE
jgi:hypothetical protein